MKFTLHTILTLMIIFSIQNTLLIATGAPTQQTLDYIQKTVTCVRISAECLSGCVVGGLICLATAAVRMPLSACACCGVYCFRCSPCCNECTADVNCEYCSTILDHRCVEKCCLFGRMSTCMLCCPVCCCDCCCGDGKVDLYAESMYRSARDARRNNAHRRKIQAELEASAKAPDLDSAGIEELMEAAAAFGLGVEEEEKV